MLLALDQCKTYKSTLLKSVKSIENSLSSFEELRMQLEKNEGPLWDGFKLTLENSIHFNLGETESAITNLIDLFPAIKNIRFIKPSNQGFHRIIAQWIQCHKCIMETINEMLEVVGRMMKSLEEYERISAETPAKVEMSSEVGNMCLDLAKKGKSAHKEYLETSVKHEHIQMKLALFGLLKKFEDAEIATVNVGAENEKEDRDEEMLVYNAYHEEAPPEF